MKGGVRTWPVWLLALVLGGLALTFSSRRTDRIQTAGDAPTHAPATPSAEALSAAAPAPPAEPSTPPAAPAASCAPHAERRCSDGDVWWFDGCGAREEEAEECDLAPCRDGQCQRPDPLGCDEPPTGRCEGDRVRSCFGGRLRTVDCAALGLHCVLGMEGAECRTEPSRVPEAPACLGDDSRCEGDTWVRCVAGRELRTDCQKQAGACLELAEGAACAVDVPGFAPGDRKGDCDACGCPADPAVTERCNGQDDDGDGLIDEDVDCGAIPLVAYVVGVPGRFGSYEASDIEREVARVNGYLASVDDGAPPLHVVLDDIVWLDHPEWRELPEEALDTLVHAPALHPQREEFAIPVLFTDEVFIGAVPKPGSSTLPNGSCGGRQRGRGPDVGLIAVSKARAPSTVAHEIGHFLGLCHTHEQQQVTGVHVVTEADGSPLVCEEACRGEGDGICDTPLDPGALDCPYNSQCQVFCPGPESPDATNLMSYYTDCRFRFTPQQLARMRHTLALRRAWHPCLDGACPCVPGQPSCPPEMGCRTVRSGEGEPSTNVCVLQGAVPAGGPCESGFDCGADARCVGSERGARCVRVCGVTASACTCVRPAGMPVSLCAADLP